MKTRKHKEDKKDLTQRLKDTKNTNSELLTQLKSTCFNFCAVRHSLSVETGCLSRHGMPPGMPL